MLANLCCLMFLILLIIVYYRKKSINNTENYMKNQFIPRDSRIFVGMYKNFSEILTSIPVDNFWIFLSPTKNTGYGIAVPGREAGYFLGLRMRLS